MYRTLGEKSVVDLYNKSGRNDSKLKAIQESIISNGETVANLKIGKNPMRIQITLELMNKIGLTLRKLSEINQLVLKTPGVVKKTYIDNLILEELTSTNEIEGINTERESVRRFLKGEISEIKEKNLINYYITIINNIQIITSVEDIRSLYEDFLDSYIEDEDLTDLGSLFRKDTVEVVTNTGKVIHRGIEGEDKIIEEMEKLIDFLASNEYETLIKVSIFHYYFGYIHPFYDGNGRLNRLITSMYLYEDMNLSALMIAKVINENRKLYYKMYEDSNSQLSCGDITFFVYNFIGFIEIAIDRTIGELRLLNKKVDYSYKMIQQFKFDRKEYYEIIFFIFQGYISHQSMDIDDIGAYINRTKPTTTKYVTELIEQDIVYREKNSKKFIYKLNDKIIKEILEEE